MTSYLKMPAACFSSFDAAATLSKFGIKPEVKYCNNYSVKVSEAVTVKVEIRESYMFLSVLKEGREFTKSYINKTSDIERSIESLNSHCAKFIAGFGIQKQND